ncbi:hypothetical protein [Roseisalinus antarcticus]|uniref:Uncharacterized protein n=1 Tax=Roseisalinus antarcticus TaxID=254357 RepID=A0A1Y5T087_9RHOB|nr:hypothetical protein [Roseisalinus antarcticus]SLN49094.1 hypothetical protein ROA7023_02100 [Roseisalinus antarcticus]
MAYLSAGQAVALVAVELAEAGKTLQSLEHALMQDPRGADQKSFPTDFQSLDLLAQSIEELRLYLSRLSQEIGDDASSFDLSGPLSEVRLGEMRRRLSGRSRQAEPRQEHGDIDLF